MPVKRVPHKPPKKDVPASSEARSGHRDPTEARGARAAASAEEVPQRPSVAEAATLDAARCSILCPLGATVPANHLRAHRALLASVGAALGDIVTVTAGERTAFLRAFAATGPCAAMPPAGVAVAEDAASFLVDREGSLALFADEVPPLGTVRLDVVESRLSDPPLCTSDQLAALFRAALRQDVVFEGMQWSCAVATRKVTCRVIACVSRLAEPLHCGFLVDSSRVEVLHNSSPPCAAPVDEPGLAASPPAPRRHTLVVGGPRMGKTHRARLLAGSMRTIFDAATTVEEGPGGTATASLAAHERLHWLAVHARHAQPAVLLLDPLDTWLGAAASPAAAFRFAATLAQVLRNTPAGEVQVIATCADAASLPTPLRGADVFGDIEFLRPPASAAERAAVLRGMLEPLCDVSQDAMAQSVEQAAAVSHGFGHDDLAKLVMVAQSLAFSLTGQAVPRAGDLTAAVPKVRPSVLHTLEVTVPKTRWSDIGGSDEAKRVLTECVEWCLGRQRSVFSLLNVPPPKGVLLYGPPGCSKTMLAKALAHESGMNFVSVKGPEVFSKWVGDSEKAVRDLFRHARAAAPCVVFIDELDGMCGRRGGGGVGDRVISQLLTELDGLPAAITDKSDSLILVAATNRPENIDPAVLRPGRIDRRVFVGLPTAEERESIAALHLRSLPCAEGVSSAAVADATAGYTGAEVVAVCKEAAFQALERSIDAANVEAVDLAAAMAKVRPRIAAAEVEWYKRWGEGSHF